MKKVLTTIMIVLASFSISLAQNYAELYVINIANGEEIHLCDNEFDGAIIYGRTGCEQNEWYVNGQYYITDQVTVNRFESTTFSISNLACGHGTEFTVTFENSQINNPFTVPIIWKRHGESVSLIAGIQGGIYTFLWSNNATTPEIQVTVPGIYSVTMTNIYGCGSETFSVEVCDNVEIELATCDLGSNLNMLTWPVTQEQGEYIDHLNVKRDGMIVGTADYFAGYYIDNIGSDAAARTYTIVAITTDGTECPIESYPKETIHMSYTLGVNNTIEVGWNTPTGYDLLGYNICEWHPSGKDGDLIVIDYVGASVNTYTCSESQFDHGNIVIQGVEAGKSENRLLSNRSWETVDIGEQTASTFEIYPNPTKGRVTIEGAGTLTVTNAIGQVVLTKEINGKESIELPRGLYFVKLGGITRKIVVE